MVITGFLNWLTQVTTRDSDDLAITVDKIQAKQRTTKIEFDKVWRIDTALDDTIATDLCLDIDTTDLEDVFGNAISITDPKLLIIKATEVGVSIATTVGGTDSEVDILLGAGGCLKLYDPEGIMLPGLTAIRICNIDPTGGPGEVQVVLAE